MAREHSKDMNLNKLPRDREGQRSLVSTVHGGHKELDTT